MKKYKYVVVSGCSFSASDAVNLIDSGETYGDLIAKQLEAKFYNLAQSGGSVEYVNRTILEWCGKNKDKFEDTLFILGMPHLDRWTVWSNKTKQWVNINIGFLSDRGLDDHFYSFNNKKITNFAKNCWNENEQLRRTINTIVGLQSFFKVNNIDSVFFDASIEAIGEYYKWCDENAFGEQYSNKLLWDSLIKTEYWYKHPKYRGFIDLTRNNVDMRVDQKKWPGDLHPNVKAHKYWAKCLMEFIDEKINT